MVDEGLVMVITPWKESKMLLVLGVEINNRILKL